MTQYLKHYEQNFQIRTEMKNPDNVGEEDFDLSSKVQLFRIIQESLANTRKHARAGSVTVEFHKTDTELFIAITDDGAGFDLKDYANGKPSFGLEIMKDRARQIGGDLRIATAPGQGTSITFAVPRAADAVQDAQAAAPQGEAEAKIKVLLADDHALFMEGLINLISPHGYEAVGKARDGIEALEKARLLHPDMVLMDMQMPRCNGLTATRLIKAEMPEVKVVILTMSDREQDLFEAIQNGASGFYSRASGRKS